MAKRENIFLRKDGRYEARYAKGRNENGKLIYGFCYGRTYEEAKEKARAAKEALEKEAMDRKAGKSTFAYYCSHWLSVSSTRLKESSYAKYQTDIKNHIAPFFGNRRPDEITSEKVDQFACQLLQEKKLSAKTVRNILVLFHTILLYARKRTEQSLPDVEIVYPKDRKKKIRVLDEREEETLCRYLVSEMDLCKFGVYIALRTGLRIGEVCALKWSDLCMYTNTLSVNHTVQRIKKTDLQGCVKTRIVVGPPKSDSSCRVIPLMPDIAVLCARFSPDNRDTFILTGTDQCMEPRKLQRRLKVYTDACRMEEVHFHTLRHTFATRCIEVGFDIKTLSEILGHSNISITLNQYVHPNLDRKRENMSRLKTVMGF